MSSIHYKFKATLEYKTLTFNGLHISVNDLKKEICEKENIKAESFDLLLTNAHTKRQYNSDEFIPRNSSVVVQRSPRDNAVKLPKVQDSTNSGIVSKGTTTDGTCKGHMGSAQFNQLSEEERIAHIKEVSAFKYQPSNFQKKSSSILWGPPPPTYQCNRCSQSGHWYKNCPMLNTRRTTGITMDELMETTADDPLAMLHPSGKFVVPIMHWKARQQKKTELSRAPEPDNRVIPPELKCPLCAQLLRDAVLTTCCGDSFCAECVQQRLLESVNAKCPGANCIQTSISADKIVPNLKVRQAVEAFKKAASPAQNVASSSQRSPVLQQRSLDTPPIPEEPPKVQAQPVPRVRIGLGSRMQAAQQLDSSQQNAMPTHEQQPQPSSAASSLEDSGISNMSMGVQAIRPHVPVPQQQQQQQLPQLPPPPAPQPQPVVGGVVLAPAPPSLESPKMANTIAMPPMAPMAPPITPMLLPVGGVLPVNVHEPPPGYAPVVTSAPPTAPIPASTKVIASADGRGVASMLPSMTAPPPPIIVQPPPLQQPPPPGLHTATTFPPVPAPPQVRDAWDEFLERKEKIAAIREKRESTREEEYEDFRGTKWQLKRREMKRYRIFHRRMRHQLSVSVFESCGDDFSRRRHSSPSESYSSTESSTQSSSDSRSRSRSWSRERGRRERRHDSKERRRNRRIESRSPPRLYAGPPRYYRDSASSHNIYQHPPPAPLNASQTTFAHHRLPALINYPPPSFLQTSNTSLAGFQSMPGSLPPAGGYRGARGCVDDRSQRRRSPPRVTETDRRVSKRGSTGREREGDRKRTDESRRRVRENEERNVRGDERPGRSRPREGAERDERRNKLREGISTKRRDRVEVKGETSASEKVSKKEGNISIDAGKGRRSHTANVTSLKDEALKKEEEKDIAEKEETLKASQETVEEGQAVKKEEAVEREEELVRIEELETFSEVFTEREDENQTIDVSGVETKEPESEEAAVAEGTDGSVSGADAENEDGTEVVEESGEQEKSEKKKRKRKKRRKRDNRSEGERERKKHHKQHKEDTSEEHDNHKKSKKRKRTREEKERHREEKERRREEKKRRRERREESGDAEEVDANAVVEIGAESHVETNKQVEDKRDSECFKEVSNESSKETTQQSREEHREKSAKRESGRKEQRREECEMSESGKKTKVEEERVKAVKRAKENALDEGTGEKRNKLSGTSEKRVLKKRAPEEEEKKKEPKKDHYGVDDSRRRDERRFRGGDVATRSERGTHRTDSNSSHQQSTKRRAESRDESRERKETKIRRDDDGIRGKEGRSQTGRDTDRPLNNTKGAEERHSEKRRSEADRDEQKKPRESVASITKRNEERPRESKSKDEEHAEKGKRIRKDEESAVRSEKKEVDKVNSVNKEEPIKKIAHRRERDETNKSSIKNDSDAKKLDEIKVSIENELASERKFGTSTSSTSGESHRDKPNITIELKYGGEKKVTRENVFENSVPQFNARQKIKMILLSESERFAVDRAKKRNVK